MGLAAWWWNGGSFSAALPPRGAEAAPVTATPPAKPTAAASRRLPPAAAPRRLPLRTRQLPSIEPAAADLPAAEPGGQPAEAGEAGCRDLPSARRGDDAGAAPAAAIPLELTFEQESWAEITDARGERLLFGLSAAGRNVTVRGEPPFAVVLGNADAVRLTVDGEPYAIPLRPPRQPRALRRRHRRGVTPTWPS